MQFVTVSPTFFGGHQQYITTSEDRLQYTALEELSEFSSASEGDLLPSPSLFCFPSLLSIKVPLIAACVPFRNDLVWSDWRRSSPASPLYPSLPSSHLPFLEVTGEERKLSRDEHLYQSVVICCRKQRVYTVHINQRSSGYPAVQFSIRWSRWSKKGTVIVLIWFRHTLVGIIKAHGFSKINILSLSLSLRLDMLHLRTLMKGRNRQHQAKAGLNSWCDVLSIKKNMHLLNHFYWALFDAHLVHIPGQPNCLLHLSSSISTWNEAQWIDWTKQFLKRLSLTHSWASLSSSTCSPLCTVPYFPLQF